MDERTALAKIAADVLAEKMAQGWGYAPGLGLTRQRVVGPLNPGEAARRMQVPVGYTRTGKGMVVPEEKKIAALLGMMGKTAQDMPSAIEDPWYAGTRLGKSGLIGTGIGALIGKNINKAVKGTNKFKTVRSRGRGALIGAGLGIGAGILGLFGDILKEKKAQRKAMGL